MPHMGVMAPVSMRRGMSKKEDLVSTKPSDAQISMETCLTIFQGLPRGTLVFDIFKDYSDEVGAHALWADAVMTNSLRLDLLFLATVSY